MRQMCSAVGTFRRTPGTASLPRPSTERELDAPSRMAIQGTFIAVYGTSYGEPGEFSGPKAAKAGDSGDLGRATCAADPTPFPAALPTPDKPIYRAYSDGLQVFTRASVCLPKSGGRA